MRFSKLVPMIAIVALPAAANPCLELFQAGLESEARETAFLELASRGLSRQATKAREVFEGLFRVVDASRFYSLALIQYQIRGLQATPELEEYLYRALTDSDPRFRYGRRAVISELKENPGLADLSVRVARWVHEQVLEGTYSEDINAEVVLEGLRLHRPQELIKLSEEVWLEFLGNPSKSLRNLLISHARQLHHLESSYPSASELMKRIEVLESQLVRVARGRSQSSNLPLNPAAPESREFARSSVLEHAIEFLGRSRFEITSIGDRGQTDSPIRIGASSADMAELVRAIDILNQPGADLRAPTTVTELASKNGLASEAIARLETMERDFLEGREEFLEGAAEELEYRVIIARTWLLRVMDSRDQGRYFNTPRRDEGDYARTEEAASVISRAAMSSQLALDTLKQLASSRIQSYESRMYYSNKLNALLNPNP